jgi:Icc-related predicted phosphoesterase
MKLLVISDIHAERHPHAFDLPVGMDFDVAVFAGDIACGPAAIDWLLGQDALNGKPLVFVPGNHEYYGGLLQDSAMLIRSAAIGTNVTVLDGDIVAVIDGVRFLGCTLWTDFSFMASSQLAGLQAGMRINDCRFITTADGGQFPRPFVPKEALRRHLIERQWLEDRLAEPHDGPTVCITHHAVHPQSLHPRHTAAGAVNAAFISDLSGMIEAYQPDLWIHGHVHDSHDYVVGSTRVVCNPRGYPIGTMSSENRHFIPDLVVELPNSAISQPARGGDE